MCNLSTGVYNKGYDSGYSSGYDSGISMGEIKKAKETTYELKDMGMPDEKIAQAVKVSTDTIQDWLAERD